MLLLKRRPVTSMNRMVLDDSLGARLRDLEEAELFDPAGHRVGRFLSEELFLRLVYDWANAQVTDEELERRRQSPGGKSLAQIWARLRKA
jgi:hypothetical protein